MNSTGGTTSVDAGWLSLSVAWIAGAAAGVVVIVLVVVVAIVVFVVVSRRQRNSRL